MLINAQEAYDARTAYAKRPEIRGIDDPQEAYGYSAITTRKVEVFPYTEGRSSDGDNAGYFAKRTIELGEAEGPSRYAGPVMRKTVRTDVSRNPSQKTRQRNIETGTSTGGRLFTQVATTITEPSDVHHYRDYKLSDEAAFGVRAVGGGSQRVADELLYHAEGADTVDFSATRWELAFFQNDLAMGVERERQAEEFRQAMAGQLALDSLVQVEA